MDKKIQEYLKSEDRELQAIGFELLNSMKTNVKHKVFILYESGYKEWKKKDNFLTKCGNFYKFYKVNSGVFENYSFGPMDLWSNKVTKDVPNLYMNEQL